MRSLPISYWEKRSERLFKKADDMGDILSSDIKIFQKQRRLYEEAALIAMMLNTFEVIIDKVTKEIQELQYIIARTEKPYEPQEF